jgi:hypothetical protein
LRYIYSPALIPNQSHIKVVLNDEIVGVAPITKENAGRQVTQDIPIDPRFIIDFNRLRLQFVGHYAIECEDPLHTSLWADISGTSELELQIKPLAIRNDLSLLPEPFFDKRDARRLNLPMVFAARPSHATILAAGVVSSWFGGLASWRGAHFPASLGELPKGHAVVFATNDQRPIFLDKEDPVAGPTLSIITNPADGYSKLLLVQGRDAKDLKIAADALALGNAAMSGASATVKEAISVEPRKPYDAPKWVRLDRPMKFGELVEGAQELQVYGHQPDAVRVSLRIPPDLFTWHSRGVPVDLKFRYTPPLGLSESRLSMAINDELVQSFNLRPTGQGGDSTRVRLPLIDDALLGDAKEVFIPAFKLGSRNQLQFSFSFTYFKDSACRDTQVENVRAMIDADSKVDFTGFPNYAEMPHIGHFASAGFPFTKYADLSQTVAVLPDQPAAQEITALLTLLGRMGESTGYPSTRLRIAGPLDDAALKDADLLVVGVAPGQGLLTRWAKSLPAIISGQTRQISLPRRGVSFLFDWLGFETQPDPTPATRSSMESQGPLAALLGFESPLTSGRSVVVFTATTAENLGQALEALDDPGLVKNMHGSTVFLHKQKVESFLVGKTYIVGYLPFWLAIWFPLSEHPVLLALMAVLAVLIFAFALWRTLKAKAARRIREERQ